MKGSRLYMLILFAILVLVFINEYLAPHKFSWEPSYDKDDKEPFGCFVFDDIMSSSIDNYSVADKSFYQIVKEDSTISKHAFLIMEERLNLNDVDIESMFKLIYQGNQVMLCIDRFPYSLQDTLSFSTEYDYSYIPPISEFIAENKTRDSIFFGTDTLNPELIFEVYPQLHKTNLVAGRVRRIYEVTQHLSPKGPVKISNVDSISSYDNGIIIYDKERVIVENLKINDSTDINNFKQYLDNGEIIIYNKDIYDFKSFEGIIYDDELPDDEEINEEYFYEYDDDDDNYDFKEYEFSNDSDSAREIYIYKKDTIDTIKFIDYRITVIRQTKPEFYPLKCDSMQVLVWDNKNNPLVIRAFLGEGEIFLVNTPLMFTNYGVLDNTSYIFRLLSYMKDKPMIRIESYGKHGNNKDTPLRYILSVAQLRWALYFTLFLILAFMFFAAKRRQRVIPIVNAPQNKNIEFMQLISNLYYQKHNNIEILKMKHTYFCAEVKSLTGIDLQENISDESDSKRLIEKTGMEIDFIRDLLKNIQISLYASQVNDIQLKQYIDGMNKILKQLKIEN